MCMNSYVFTIFAPLVHYKIIINRNLIENLELSDLSADVLYRSASTTLVYNRLSGGANRKLIAKRSGKVGLSPTLKSKSSPGLIQSFNN